MKILRITTVVSLLIGLLSSYATLCAARGAWEGDFQEAGSCDRAAVA